MILTVTFKTPDAVEDAIPEFESCEEHPEYDGSCPDCLNYKHWAENSGSHTFKPHWLKKAIRDRKRDIIENISKFTDGEYVTVQFDTDAGTATVVARK